MEWLVATDIIFDKSIGGKRSKIKWLFNSNMNYLGYFKQGHIQTWFVLLEWYGHLYFMEKLHKIVYKYLEIKLF